MNGRICFQKCFILFFLILVFMFGYYLYNKKQITIINNCIEDSIKLQERTKPVNNMTYPAFTHPLAPPYPFPYKFLINQPDKCKNRKPFLVLMVVVRCQDLESRHTIRETWGNESSYDVEVVRIFLVGLPQIAPAQTQDLLEEESEMFKDIVQEDFMDTYYNLTLKTLMGMEWVTKFCPSARYAMKVDSDMFLNVDYLIHNVLYPDVPVRTNYFTGAIIKDSRPVRYKASKSYVPMEIYPNNTYPPYCTGAGYVFSLDMAQKIYDVAQEIRVIPVEDAFMGICLYELHIPISESPTGSFIIYRLNYDHCKFRKVVRVQDYSGEELRKIWADFQAKKSQNC
ncbi:beta-1,3-galactosyltransferase 2-like isoform 1-T3 [Anomaloglossus baeobatrachus]|uniref:beta-1,3-galactosyltransferase 2-like n=1 Tax=Anomaloglossus baeobatrachus TaxID=238106 RepID=UPI003F50ADA2